MPNEFGEPLNVSLPTILAPETQADLGVDLRVSKEALRDIEEIEANIRTAEQRSGVIILR